MMDIDFVITWVNQDDIKWEKKYNQYRNIDVDGEKKIRYRDYGTLRYLFRGIEMFAPWVHKVFLVTDDQIPDWLNTEYNKVVVIDHTQIIDKKFLPTFNSNVIDFNLANIPTLSEHFVYFNDDMFLNAPVRPQDFFNDQGFPMDNLSFNLIMPTGGFDHVYVNNVSIINNAFSKKTVIKKNFFKIFNYKNGAWNLVNMLLLPFPRFSRFFDGHVPISYRKSSILTVLDHYPEIRKQFNNHIRTKSDFSLWLVRYVDLLNGHFSVRNVRFGKKFRLSDIERIQQNIQSGRTSLININDDDLVSDDEFEYVVEALSSAFNRRLPKPSRFEK